MRTVNRSNDAAITGRATLESHLPFGSAKSCAESGAYPKDRFWE